MNPSQPEQEDAQLIAMLEDVTYFNLEVSPCWSSLVFNASKKGIDAFLALYGNLVRPPPMISFVSWERYRKWLSSKICENKQVKVTDPTPYKVNCVNTYTWNYLVPNLYIDFIDNHETEIILCAGVRDEAPVLTVNKKGWNIFLTLLHKLRDQSYWFFVTDPNPSYQGPPFFHLTKPYMGEAQDHVFKAIEFIRLEPVEDIFLDTCRGGIYANATGLLLFSHWMYDFAYSEEKFTNYYNKWNNLPKTLVNESTYTQPQQIYLHKIRQDSSYPLFSFERKEENNDLYVFGNANGFKEIANIVEEYAFYSDHDDFRSNLPEKRARGEVVEGGFGLEGFRAWGYAWGWGIVGGGLLTPQYNPTRFSDTPANPFPHLTEEDEIEQSFLNLRILFQ